MEPKTLGVIGGMGPEAAVEFCRRLVRLTPVTRDQDHIPTILINDPGLPDRTAAILHKGPSPLPMLQRTAKRLEDLGCTLIAIPCNTAHYWYEELQAATSVPVLNIIDATVEQLARLAAGKCAGLLATDGTLSSRLYQRKLEASGVQYVTPDADDQRRVMDVVYSIKRSGVDSAVRAKIHLVAQGLIDDGAEALITGCTEIPLALDAMKDNLGVPVADSITALAEAVLNKMRPGWRDKDGK